MNLVAEIGINHHGDEKYTLDYVDKLINTKIDAIIVATPVYTHYEIAKKALQSGKHVLLDGAMNLNWAYFNSEYEDQQVSTTGEFVTHHTSLNVPGPTPDVMLAALGPKMLTLASERTAGTITWMTGPKTIESHIRPGIGNGHIAAGVPIFITDDVPAAREFAGRTLAIYGQLPSYRAMLDREGMDGPADMVLAGDLETVRSGLEAYKAAGVDEIAMNVLGTGESLEATWELAASLGGVM